jgi:multiphosphoryl transfer protein
MVGIVLVSHSATLAAGVAELAREMGGPEVPLEIAGGTALDDAPLGTDAMLVIDAITRAQSPDGVLVLMDLGSAVLSAEMAVEMLPDDVTSEVLLCEAPFVEGAVAAATAARIGLGLEEVAAEARGGLGGKIAHLGGGADQEAPSAPETPPGAGEVADIEVTNRLGLHARPAARFVKIAAGFDAHVEVENLTTGAGPASGKSLNAVTTLGVRRGHVVRVRALGPEATEALAAIRTLADQNFGDVEDEEAAAPAGPVIEAPVAVGEEVPSGAIRGLPAAPGIAIGPARRFGRAVPSVSDRPPGAPDAEWARLQKAIDDARAEIQRTRDATAGRLGETHAEIFDAHLLMLEDETLMEGARRGIFDDGHNASESWASAVNAAAGALRAVEDEYLAARGDDIEQVGADVLRELQGEHHVETVVQPGVIVALELTPADTATLDSEIAKAFVTATGGPTSHSAILARAIGVPAVVGAGSAVADIPEGSNVIVDGTRGLVLVDPPADVSENYRSRLKEEHRSRSRAQAQASRSAVTGDGTRIEIVANIGGPGDVLRAMESGAEGVGLLRTEFLYLDRSHPPEEQEQYEALRDIAARLDGRPVVVRTLDAGADKPLKFFRGRSEENPFLGIRGVRLSLANPEIFSTQLRAVARVAAEWPIKIMFPMVATIGEFERASELLAEAATSAGAGREGLEVGIMVEVPAAALSAATFATSVDFFSIGTNDLTQYTMAADRGNEGVAELADPLHPAVLRLIAEVTAAAETHGKWVGVCGELAGDPVATAVLVGLGVTELSMSAPSIPLIKESVRGVDVSDARDLARRALSLSSGAEVRALVAESSVGFGTAHR